MRVLVVAYALKSVQKGLSASFSNKPVELTLTALGIVDFLLLGLLLDSWCHEGGMVSASSRISHAE